MSEILGDGWRTLKNAFQQVRISTLTSLQSIKGKEQGVLWGFGVAGVSQAW
jgi:hypothetical protein